MPAKIISVINQKGGVGKTTTARNMGHALRLLGRRVLLVDFDPQSNLTYNFGLDLTNESDPTVADLIGCAMEEKELPPAEGYIKRFEESDLIPSSIDLASLEIKLINIMSREYMLGEVLSRVRDSYDYIIIDCSPSLGILTLNALAACDDVIIVSTPQFFSAKGICLIVNTVNQIKRRINPRINISGILVTMFRENTNSHKRIRELIESEFGDSVRMFGAVIPNTVKFDEASSAGMSMIGYDRGSRASEAYIAFTEEYLNLIENPPKLQEIAGQARNDDL